MHNDVKFKDRILRVANAFAEHDLAVQLICDLKKDPDFLDYWNTHSEEILGLSIDLETCKQIADKLHDIYVQTGGRAFTTLFDTCGLSKESVCCIRLLTANLDCVGSRSFSDVACIYETDPTVFDIDSILEDPDSFLSALGGMMLSKNDTSRQHAVNFAAFVKEHGGTPIRLVSHFGKDVSALRDAMISCDGAGYGKTKTDMVIRDMVVQGIWNDVSGFDKIDVISDSNTVGVALRTGLLRSNIPLVSSFLDELCYQYGYVDAKNAEAWREVWKAWAAMHPEDGISSPCLLDYFVCDVIGKQFCRESLAIFECEQGHVFRWHTEQNRTCQICFLNGNTREKARLVGKVLPCTDSEGHIAIRKTEYVKSGVAPEGMTQCPFKEICDWSRKHDL